jgi:hypothetical protein
MHPEDDVAILMPERDWSGQESLMFVASHNDTELSCMANVIVTPVNDPPGPVQILQPMDDYKLVEGTPWNFSAVCTDPDLVYGDSLTYVWSSNVAGRLGINATVTNITLPPGDHKVTVVVTDSVGLSSSAEVEITVFPLSEEDDDEQADGPYDDFDFEEGAVGIDRTNEFLLIIFLIIGILIVIIGENVIDRKLDREIKEKEKPLLEAEIVKEPENPPLTGNVIGTR